MVAFPWSRRLVLPTFVAALLALGWVATTLRAADALPRRVVAFAGLAPSANRSPQAVLTLAELPACDESLSLMLARANPAANGPEVGAWYRLDPRRDAGGFLVGQVLSVGLGAAQTRVALDAESAASGPAGAAVLVLSDDGTRSTLAVVDARTGCVRPIAGSDAIVRRAMLVPDGGAIVEHQLDRSTRTSLGIWRRPIDGGDAVRILAPIGSDDRFGRTYSTELAWADDGRLVVQSCGAAACRTRVLDLVSGRPELAINDDRQGEMIGVGGSTLVTYGACAGLPCTIVATDLRGAGPTRVLADQAGFARLLTGVGGTRLVHEVGRPGSGVLRTVALTGGLESTVDVGEGLLLAPAPARSGSSIALPPGWLLLSDDGRSQGPGTHRLMDPWSGRQQDLSEVTR